MGLYRERYSLLLHCNYSITYNEPFPPNLLQQGMDQIFFLHHQSRILCVGMVINIPSSSFAFSIFAFGNCVFDTLCYSANSHLVNHCLVCTDRAILNLRFDLGLSVVVLFKQKYDGCTLLLFCMFSRPICISPFCEELCCRMKCAK